MTIESGSGKPTSLGEGELRVDPNMDRKVASAVAKVVERNSKPCHYLFSLEVSDSRGIHSETHFLQVETREALPENATNIRPVRVGDVLWTELDGKHRAIHVHGPSEEERSFEGFPYSQTALELIPVPLGKRILQRIKELRPRRGFSPPWLEE